MIDKIETKDQIITTEETSIKLDNQSPRVLTANEIEKTAGGPSISNYAEYD